MDNLNIRPKVLPNKILIKAYKSKLYILIQPFVVIVGCSINRLVVNSTLAQISLSFTTHLRKIDNEEPGLSTINFLALVLGKV